MASIGIELSGERHARKRALLRAALRDGDVLGAARAWERLRVDPSILRRDEAAAARAARATVGRAIRDARWRRAHVLPSPSLPPMEMPEIPSGVRVRRVLLAAALCALALLLIWVLAPETPVEGGSPAPAPAVVPEVIQPQTIVAAITGARGRTTATLAPVVVSAEPVPTQTPAPTQSAAPSPTTGPAPVAGGVPGGTGTGGTGSGGTGTGSGGGTGSGSATPSPTPRPTPTPSPTPRIVAEGAPPPRVGDRFVFRVVDSRTGQPLPGICVVLGTLECGPNDYHTNSLGYYWLDMERGMATAWSFKFTDPRYFTTSVNRTYNPGMGTVTTTINLRRR